MLYVIVLTLPCVVMMLWPKMQAKRVEKRIADGDDRFFEEQRTYQAYPHMRDSRRIRMIGAIGTICGVAACILQFYRG